MSQSLVSSHTKKNTKINLRCLAFLWLAVIFWCSTTCLFFSKSSSISWLLPSFLTVPHSYLKGWLPGYLVLSKVLKRRRQWHPTPVLLPEKIPWMEEPGRLWSMGSKRVGQDWATSFSLFTFMHWRRKWQPTPVFLPGESQGWGAWWAAVYGIAQSWTQLKWLSSSSKVLKT